MNVYGELLKAQLENLSALPGATLAGRVWYRSDINSGTAQLDTGALVKNFLLNDQAIVIGTNGTANTNARVYRSGTTELCWVKGGDATAEATRPSPANFATLGFALLTDTTTNLTALARKAGAIYWDSTLVNPTYDTGTALVSLAKKSPTIQRFTSGSGTYTTPAGALWLRVRISGPGGGGQGSGTAAGASATQGTSTTFSIHSGSAILTATSGNVSVALGASTPVGGTATVAAGATSVIAISGSNGGGGNANGTTGLSVTGGNGGSNCFGESGAGGVGGSAGSSAPANSGGGGGGGGSNNTNSSTSGNGGGAGGYIEAIISAPSASYDYVVGTGGAAGTAGANGRDGGSGSAGVVIVEEFY